MQITCLTPTGDRPKSLALSRKYFERAKEYLENSIIVNWLVIDDGIVPCNPGGCTYLRREPDGPNSLGRNLAYALNKGALEADYLFMWEDDDWYAPTRISNQLRQLRTYQLVGYKNSIYYHLEKKGIFRHENLAHSSLFETAMTRQTAYQFKAIIQKNINEPFLDMLLWRGVKGKLYSHDRQAIGLKGGEGRTGLGVGHKDKLKYVPKPLEDLIGDDAKHYQGEDERYELFAACGIL